MLPSAVASEEQEEANVASSTEKTSMPWGVPDAASSTHSASAQPAASQGGDGGYVHGFCCTGALLPAFGIYKTAVRAARYVGCLSCIVDANMCTRE